MKTGLVLEGGAMRGLFSAGVMDVLMEQDVQLLIIDVMMPKMDGLLVLEKVCQGLPGIFCQGRTAGSSATTAASTATETTWG